jgi:hypothetical protein
VVVLLVFSLQADWSHGYDRASRMRGHIGLSQTRNINRWTLASGDDAKAAQGTGVTDADRRQPAINQPPHAVPQNSAVLAASRQRAMPEPADVEPKQVERGRVHGHPIIMDVSVDHRAQPLAHLRDRVVHASPEFGGDLTQLSLQSLANRLPQHRKPSLTPLLSADMREAKEVEAFGLPLTAPQLQSELPNTLGQFLPAALGIRPVLESEHDIIGEPDDNHVAVGLLLAPRPDPQVEHVVETDVREQWRCAAALRRPFFHRHPFSCSPTLTKLKTRGLWQHGWFTGSGAMCGDARDHAGEAQPDHPAFGHGMLGHRHQARALSGYLVGLTPLEGW